MKVKVKCPYCNHENKVNTEEGKLYQQQVVTCNCDEGGCDRDFVVAMYITIQVECKKIEGEAEKN